MLRSQAPHGFPFPSHATDELMNAIMHQTTTATQKQQNRTNKQARRRNNKIHKKQTTTTHKIQTMPY
jgi:hypothetical protein